MAENQEYLVPFVNFGQPSFNEYTASFYTLINDAIIKLVRSLPRSVQTSAMIFFMQHAGIESGQPLDFFRNYYSPIWSSIPHIIQMNKGAIVHDEFIYSAGKLHHILSSEDYWCAVGEDTITCASCDYRALCHKAGMQRPSENFRYMYDDVPYCKRVIVGAHRYMSL